MTPEIMTCFYCGKSTGIALLPKETPHRGCVDYAPCRDCDELMTDGILLLGCTGGPQARTGQMWAIKEEDVGSIFSGEAAADVLKYRCAFIEAAAAQDLGLPAEGVENLERVEDLKIPEYAPIQVYGEPRSGFPWKDKVLRRRQAEVEVEGGSLHVRYGWTVIDDQEPYLAVTADELDERGVVVATGMLHDAVAKAFPGLTRLLRWHLCSTTEPMHYVANGIYWWQMFKKRSKWKSESRRPLRNFASTIVYGAVDDDAAKILVMESDRDVEQWLVSRRAALLSAMWADSAAYGLDTIEGAEE